MNKEKFQELLQLYFADELSEEQKAELLQYIKINPEADSEFKQMKAFFNSVTASKPSLMQDNILEESRKELFRAIRKEQLKPSLIESVKNWIDGLYLSGYKLAVGSAFSIVFGLMIGYFLFQPGKLEIVQNSSNDVISIDEIINSGKSIENIRLSSESIPGDKITITFETSKPYTYSGSMEDKNIQRLLAGIITSSDNPGMRLQTVSALNQKADSKFMPDLQIKEALITSLKKDNNAAVRRSALELLKKYPYDNSIRDALLYVLSNDTNSGVRIAAINVLAELKLQGTQLDSTVESQLNNNIKTEQNLFIKNLAESLVKGDEL